MINFHEKFRCFCFFLRPAGAPLSQQPTSGKWLVSVTCVRADKSRFLRRAYAPVEFYSSRVNFRPSIFGFQKISTKTWRNHYKEWSRFSRFWTLFGELFWIFSFAKPGHRGRLTIEIRAFIRKANHNKMSGHVFELHTPVLELGLRGATHALRVLSSIPPCFGGGPGWGRQ